MIATIISYPNNDINESIDIQDTNNSYELVQNLWIDLTQIVNDEHIEVTYDSRTVTLYVTEECRYTPVDIAFINKDGALQFIAFFKARNSSLAVTDETFESDRSQPLTSPHQFVRYNVQGRTSLSINSGFVDEDNNEDFKQLFLSEKVWIYDGSYTPINLESKTLNYKNRQNDRLISYEVRFKYAYNEVNNI